MHRQRGSVHDPWPRCHRPQATGSLRSLLVCSQPPSHSQLAANGLCASTPCNQARPHRLSLSRPSGRTQRTPQRSSSPFSVQQKISAPSIHRQYTVHLTLPLGKAQNRSKTRPHARQVPPRRTTCDPHSPTLHSCQALNPAQTNESRSPPRSTHDACGHSCRTRRHSLWHALLNRDAGAGLRGAGRPRGHRDGENGV